MKDGKHVVLCIDDDPDFLMAVRAIIEPKGYAVVEAASAEEGLRAYKEARPDLVIVDLMMEEVDAGTHFVKEIKALGETTPIYMLSSVGDDLSMTTDYTELGLDGVLQKPVEPQMLLGILERKLK